MLKDEVQPTRSPAELFDLTGRVALVTGGTRGLGRAILRTLAQAGADVVVASRKQEACEEAAAEVRGIGRRAVAHCCHIGHWDEIDSLVDAAYDAFGRVDVLVNRGTVRESVDDLGHHHFRPRETLSLAQR